MSFDWKKVVRQLHLWLGIASGLVVFLVAITGAIWTFESEISDVIYSYRKVAPQHKAYLLPSQLKAIAQPYFGNLEIKAIQFSEKNRAVLLRHWSEKDGKETHIQAYLNPYTGQVLHIEKGLTFFDIVIELHVNLMLGNFGRHVVDYATLIFIVLLVSGIILWWPKNKAAAQQRFWFKWKSGLKWKRKNYDLHNILGFYASFVVIFVAITGLAWGFKWVDKTIYYTATLGDEFKDWPDPVSASDTNTIALLPVDDMVYHKAISKYAKPMEGISMYFPNKKQEAISVYINPSSTTWYESTAFYFDQRTGKQLLAYGPDHMNNGEKIRNMYYDIHIGKILGLPGQLLVFFASLIVASLPVTGFMIWYGRRKTKSIVVKKEHEAVPITIVTVD